MDKESGAYTYRDSQEECLVLFMYSLETDDNYNVILFKNGGTYTASSKFDGILGIMRDEDMHCLKTNTFEELESKIKNYTRKDYENMMNVVNSDIELKKTAEASAEESVKEE
tara:strand:- start:1699 stop:2034 length:336 start_codon:yes stop_codon:yes gene_type:complete